MNTLKEDIEKDELDDVKSSVSELTTYLEIIQEDSIDIDNFIDIEDL